MHPLKLHAISGDPLCLVFSQILSRLCPCFLSRVLRENIGGPCPPLLLLYWLFLFLRRFLSCRHTLLTHQQKNPAESWRGCNMYNGDLHVALTCLFTDITSGFWIYVFGTDI